jgi:hypothetical protein
VEVQLSALTPVDAAGMARVGDVIVWLDAGAYHLPWETRFSHGLCPIVWFDADERMSVAREREPVGANARVAVAQ